MNAKPRHPIFTRRDMLQAGGIGVMGLSLADLSAAEPDGNRRQSKSVIYLFLSGGLAQHDSFDLKPNAPDGIRGEFRPIATQTPGIQICEHLPRLAARSRQWALVRSLTHPTNDHSLGHHIMLTGHSQAPLGFNPSKPEASDFPSLTAVAGQLVSGRNGLPSSAVLPFHLIHTTGRVIPGQFAGQMGRRHDPWLLQCAHNCPGFGACPNCIDHQDRPHQHVGRPVFEPPTLRLPEGIDPARLAHRRGLLDMLEAQQRGLDRQASRQADPHRAMAWSLLTSRQVRQAFDLSSESERLRDAYGQNLFGWSCLLARRLVEAGVGMIQVNLGRNETWDTHGNAFPHLKNNLLPPMDRCVSALIDDLAARGLLESTLIVMAGEFGRTPRISGGGTAVYALPGRDHWGAVQSVFLAGGGVQGGTVIGSSDRIGAYPASAPQTPENLAATIYDALALPRTAVWHDALQRPHFIYQAEPIADLV